MAPWLALVLAAVAPLPAAGDVRAQVQASACILYYRLQAGPPPGGSAGCEAAGYGAAFMRAHWKDVAGIEAQHQADFDAHLAHGEKVAQAQAQKRALEPLCFQMILDGGRGPDGGQALCDLAGFTRGWVVRTAHHRAESVPHGGATLPQWPWKWMLCGLGALALAWAARRGLR